MEWVIWAIVVALIVCPSRYDPAIWLKERNERKKRKPK